MSLNLVKETVSAGIPVFKKVFELFDGGFSLTVTGFNSGVELPAGSLLQVDEEARTAVPVKTAVVGATGTATTIYVETGHHFIVGEHLGVGATAATILAITASATLGLDIIDIGSATGIGVTSDGDVVWDSSGTGENASAIKTAPNALSRYAVTIESGATVTAVRRGTAFKKRIQGHTTALVATLPETIQLSDSY
jgi:hypothetical protein